MTNAPAILKSLIIYAVCVPLAVIVGYKLTSPLDFTTFAYAGILGLLLAIPLLLRWHYPLLVFSLNASMYMFFLKGRPDFWMVMVALSLCISLMDRAMNSQMRFIHVPQISMPLVCMLAVIILTAKLTGGIGLHAFGSDVFGGRKYLILSLGILSYFALTARRIPPEQARWFFGLYMLSGLTCLISDLYPITPSFLHFIFWMFPPSSIDTSSPFELGVSRLGGIAGAAGSIAFWLAARHGLRGIFLSGKPGRLVLFSLTSLMIFLGGYRIYIVSYVLVMGLMFFLEGLHRTRALPVFVLAGILGVVIIIPLAPHLPFTFQRALAFLPLNLSPEARESAEDSSQWRINMWKAVLPQVPPHLLLGKGYAISMEDYEMMGRGVSFHSVDASQQGLALAGDYHNGPLSVVIPFGIWGVMAFLWFAIAGLRVMCCNSRYGNGSLRTINIYLLASYVYVFVRFLFIFGALTGDMMALANMLGLSIALNGGVCRPARQTVQAQSPMVHPAKFLPRARPAFQR